VLSVLKRVRVWSIYGNHGNLGLPIKMYNMLTERFEPVTMDDGEAREFGGSRFGAVNGIIALREKVKRIFYTNQLKGISE